MENKIGLYRILGEGRVGIPVLARTVTIVRGHIDKVTGKRIRMHVDVDGHKLYGYHGACLVRDLTAEEEKQLFDELKASVEEF